jgi:ribosomal protein L7/L12
MPRPITNADLEAVRSELIAGQKISAIKLYREATGAGLAEAKSFVERMELNLQAPSGDFGSLSDATVQNIQAAIFAGRKIEAIKLHRMATGMGLKESKDFIEALQAELRRTEPDRFTAAPAKGCGTTALCLLLVAFILFELAAAFGS